MFVNRCNINLIHFFKWKNTPEFVVFLENSILISILHQIWGRDKKWRRYTPKYAWNKQQFDAINPDETDFALGRIQLIMLANKELKFIHFHSLANYLTNNKLHRKRKRILQSNPISSATF